MSMKKSRGDLKRGDPVNGKGDRWPTGPPLKRRWTVGKQGDYARCPTKDRKIGIMSAVNNEAVKCPLCHQKHFPPRGD